MHMTKNLPPKKAARTTFTKLNVKPIPNLFKNVLNQGCQNCHYISRKVSFSVICCVFTCSQFHQCFTSAFFVQKSFRKLFSSYIIVEKSYMKHLRTKKGGHKRLNPTNRLALVRYNRLQP